MHLSILFILFIKLTTLNCNRNACHTSDIFSYYTKDCKRDYPVKNNCNFDKINWKGLATDKQNNDIKEMASNSGLNGLYRPRSALARALYEKQRNDGHLRDIDKNEWYKVEKSRLNAELQEKFVQLGPDQETKEFLATCVDKSAWIWTQIWYLLAKTVLRHFWTVTDINGWLGRGSMFVLSKSQTCALLAAGGRAAGGGGAFVDVGAGDGEVGRRFAGLFSDHYATEISASMRKLLGSKGYTVLDAEEWWRHGRMQCVSMLNLLDRCSKPRSMLRQARAALAPGGALLVALVLPYKPYVEVTPDHRPEERLPVGGDSFEQQATSFVRWMREEGWALGAWARAPYLCEGDFTQSYYWLDDSVYVFTPTDT